MSERCAVAEAPGRKHVWIFKQWHLAASVDATDRVKAKALPQARNLESIYRQLDAWVSAGHLSAVVAEGCAGELTASSPVRFNGWNAEALREASKKPHYEDEVVTSVPLKLEAKHGDRLRTVCGDDEALIREHLLALSDARGTLGFMTRLDQYKADPTRAKTYLDGVIELYKLPKETTVSQAAKRLAEELKASVARARTAIDKRNARAVEAVASLGAGEAALVYGGMHAAGMVKLLEEKGIACTVVEPQGYQGDEAALLSRLDAALEKLGR